MTVIGTTQRNRANYLAAKQAFNRGDLDSCMAHYAPDHRLRSRGSPPGREHIRAFLADMHANWGDLWIEVEQVVAEGAWVMGRCTTTAIHAQPFMGLAPTGRRIVAAFWDLHRFDEAGLIAETWNITDGVAVMRQLTGSAATR